ncbi:MAG TPA: ABC transporter permease [Planctomycetota bacterium]|nr:ABC transporter permease [Planctomycetota bacterium]
MMTRITRLMAAEFIKLFAQPFLYISLIVLLLLTPLFEVAVPLVSGQKETVWRSFNSVQLFAYGFKSGLKVATYVLLVFSSMMFAGEFDRGTIKNLLTRPITRLEFFVAKCLTVTGLALLLFGFVFFVGSVAALWRGDVGPVWDDSSYLIQRSTEEILSHARKAVFMSFLSFLAAGFLGILVSNFTESSGYAVSIGTGLFITGELVTGMLTDRSKQKIFLYYAPYALEKLSQLGEGTTTRWDPDIDASHLYLLVPLVTIAVFLPLAFSIFRSRNISA